jgi:hypothetical protein
MNPTWLDLSKGWYDEVPLTAKPTADPFGKLRAGSSTPLDAKTLQTPLMTTLCFWTRHFEKPLRISV